jgi:lysophospholipase L1-like esterase
MKKIAIIVVLAVMALTAVAQANQDPYYARRATLFDELPIGKKDIVMLGNSLTDGCEFNELLGNRHIKNRGIVGDIVQGLIDRIDPIIKGQPKKLFIMCGVNDISHNVSADSIARATEKLIVMVKQGSPRTKIYLQSLLPFNNEVREWKLLKNQEHVVVEANILLEQVARRQGVTWINLYPLFADENGRLRADLTNDGLHLMGKGYLIWRDAIKPYVK